MKLFLASDAKDQKTFTTLTDVVGGLRNKKVAYIPTAANGEAWGSWQESTSLALLRSSGANVSIVQLEDYAFSNPLPDIEKNDLLWMAGGQCGYLMYWIRRTQLDLHMKRLLDSGMLYIGSSAGSMIAGQSLNIVEWYFTEKEYGAGIIPTLELVDFDIWPHYTDESIEEIKKNYTGNKLYLLRDGEEIIIDNDTVRVIGEERIIVNNP